MSIRLDLTPEQQAELSTLLTRAKAEGDKGEPGMTMAQLYIGSGEMVCGFVGHKQAKEIQKIMGGDGFRTTVLADDRSQSDTSQASTVPDKRRRRNDG